MHEIEGDVHVLGCNYLVVRRCFWQVCSIKPASSLHSWAILQGLLVKLGLLPGACGGAGGRGHGWARCKTCRAWASPWQIHDLFVKSTVTRKSCSTNIPYVPIGISGIISRYRKTERLVSVCQKLVIDCRKTFFLQGLAPLQYSSIPRFELQPAHSPF